MGGLGVQSVGDGAALREQVLRRIENLGNALIDLVILERRVMVELLGDEIEAAEGAQKEG